MRKVTEISLSWQQKAFKTTSRLCSAEQGVGDVLSRGVGMGSSVLGSFSGGNGNFLGGSCGLAALCCVQLLCSLP